jgi:hypothetical protein
LQSINLSVVAISAAGLLVVAAIVLLLTRGPAVPTPTTNRPAARSEFVAPARAGQPTEGDPIPSQGERAVAGSNQATPPEGSSAPPPDEGSAEADDDSPGGRNRQGKDKGRPRRFW